MAANLEITPISGHPSADVHTPLSGQAGPKQAWGLPGGPEPPCAPAARPVDRTKVRRARHHRAAIPWRRFPRSGQLVIAPSTGAASSAKRNPRQSVPNKNI